MRRIGEGLQSLAVVLLAVGGIAVTMLAASAPSAGQSATTAPSGAFPVGGWSRTSIQGASPVASMPRVGAGGNNVNAPWVAPWDGEVVGVSCASAGGCLPGNAYGVAVYVNGLPTGLSLVALGGDRACNGNPTPVPFQAGDRVELRDWKQGTVPAVGVQAQCFVRWLP
jgi:hypothetical protein